MQGEPNSDYVAEMVVDVLMQSLIQQTTVLRNRLFAALHSQLVISSRLPTSRILPAKRNLDHLFDMHCFASIRTSSREPS